MADEERDYRLAASVLAALVRDEYPSEYTLAEIASTWGNANPEQLAALERVEAHLG